METHMLDIGKEMGLPGGVAQASRWFGGGPKTDLVSAYGDWLDLIEKQAAYTLHKSGMSTDPVSVRNYVMQLIEKGGDLVPFYGKKKPMPDYRTRAPRVVGEAGRASELEDAGVVVHARKWMLSIGRATNLLNPSLGIPDGKGPHPVVHLEYLVAISIDVAKL